MTSYVALLRAVNVGGTGKLPMAGLKGMADALGFARARTYIASGNLLFDADADVATVKAALEASLATYAGRAVPVMVRTVREIAGVLAANPFPDAPGNRTVVVFLDGPPPGDTIARTSGRQDEEIRLGEREIYIAYGQNMRDSKLRVPAAATGTARNVNTVSKLAGVAAA